MTWKSRCPSPNTLFVRSIDVMGDTFLFVKDAKMVIELGKEPALWYAAAVLPLAVKFALYLAEL